MAPDTPEQPHAPEDPELDRWLDGLAGRAAPNDRDRHAEIGRRLRAHIRKQHAELADELTPEEIQTDKERLLFAARAAQSRKAGASTRSRLRVPLSLAASVTLLVAGGLVGRNVYVANYAPGLLASYGELERARGGAPLVVDAPRALPTARRLAAALEEAQVPFELNRSDDRSLSLELNVNDEQQLAAVRQLFAEWRLVFEETGYYYIIVE
jgi:hypothetical protein